MLKNTKRGIVLLVICAVILCTVTINYIFRKNEIIRVAVDGGMAYCFILYDDKTLVVEYGASTHGDIAKKPYINERMALDADFCEYFYEQEKTQITDQQMEEIISLADKFYNLKIADDLSDVSEYKHAKILYKDKAFRYNDRWPSVVEELVDKFISLSPMEIHEVRGAA